MPLLNSSKGVNLRIKRIRRKTDSIDSILRESIYPSTTISVASLVD